MTNGIPQNLNDLLSFALSLNSYVENASPWKLKRLTTTGYNLLRRVPLTLSFTADARLPNTMISLAFRVSPKPLQYHPIVVSSAPWLRRECDWHVYPDGSLCWTYPQHYFELMRELSRHLDQAELFQTAAYWCVSKCAELVQRHLTADRHSIKTWLPQWDAWPHGVDAAQAQFDEMKRSGKFDAEIRELLAARKTRSMSPLPGEGAA